MAVSCGVILFLALRAAGTSGAFYGASSPSTPAYRCMRRFRTVSAKRSGGKAELDRGDDREEGAGGDVEDGVGPRCWGR